MMTPNIRQNQQVNEARERLYAAGFHALAAHDSRKAYKSFGLMAAMCPLDERPWLGLGATHEHDSDWQLAAGCYRIARRVAERSPMPLLGEARVLGVLGKLAEARSLLDQAELIAEEPATFAQIEEIRGNL